MVQYLKSLKQFETTLKKNGDKLTVIDFTASWCGPCKKISPFFTELSNKYKDVSFHKVDVEEAEDIAQNCRVECMPTFQFFRNGTRVAIMSGANKQKLEKHIMTLREDFSDDFSSDSEGGEKKINTPKEL